MDDIPAYYFEWAATIDALPVHEQGSTLAAMPEEDAQTIQRILRHNARRRSIDETESAMMVEAQRRSLRWGVCCRAFLWDKLLQLSEVQTHQRQSMKSLQKEVLVEAGPATT